MATFLETVLDSGFAKDTFFGWARHALTAAGGSLVTLGVLTPSQASNEWLGSTLFLVGVVWSAWDKYVKTGIV